MTFNRLQAKSIPQIKLDLITMNIPALIEAMRQKAQNGEIQRLLADAGCETIAALHKEALYYYNEFEKIKNDPTKASKKAEYKQRLKPLANLLINVYALNVQYKSEMTQAEFNEYLGLQKQLAIDIEQITNNHRNHRLIAGLLLFVGVVALALGILLALTLAKVLVLPILTGIIFIDISNVIGALLAAPIIGGFGLYGLFKQDSAVEGPRSILNIIKMNQPRIIEEIPPNEQRVVEQAAASPHLVGV